MGNGLGGQQGGFTLPAALLAQYPALQGLQWDQLSSGPGEEGGGDISGRSSFDASSGGDYYEDEEGEGQGGYMSDNPMGTGVGFEAGGYMGGQGWKSDRE